MTPTTSTHTINQEIAVVLRYQADQYPKGSFNEERLRAAAEIVEREEALRKTCEEQKSIIRRQEKVISRYEDQAVDNL